ncbi:hypothetical protein [Desulfoferrobacter suflitae]|uniref:hypothetical protein n=1 Tax=Desulfoferrobacter suflitae TaxID=2865782 RepID=UPI00216482C0|nr:hypothetical protein [Desulfoferrobacter suflitae]MCK8602980.1 hypothetical protein [Desulfoferrobacter suflitae]
MTINMQGSKPYKKMRRTCRTRAVSEKRVVWPRFVSQPFAEGRFQVRPLRRQLIDSAAALWRIAYPEIYGSPHEFLLDPERYEGCVALEDNWDEDSLRRVYCMTVVEELATNQVVSATLLTKFTKNLQVEYTFAATHPDYRQSKLTDELRRMTRKIAYNSGAEYLTTFCETWHDITQYWCIKGGWKIAGIFPGNFVRWNGDNEEYRGCAVHFYRFIGAAEAHTTRPEEWHLAAPAKAVWDTLDRVNREIERAAKTSSEAIEG